MTPERPTPPAVAPPMTAEPARDAVDTRTAELNRRLEAAATAREQIAAVRARSTSEDGLVTVEVSARGTLLDLRLAPGTSALPPERLAALVLRTVRRATAEAAEAVRAVLEPAVAPGTDLAALVLDPAVPAEVPDAEPPVVDSWLRPAGPRGYR